jgi:hypothetical protein
VTVGGVRVPEAAVDFSRNNFWYGDAAHPRRRRLLERRVRAEGGSRSTRSAAPPTASGRAGASPAPAGGRWWCASLYPQGFLPSIVGTSQDYSGAVGAKGARRAGRGTSRATVGQNRFAFDVNNSNNPTLGNASPRDFYAGDAALDAADVQRGRVAAVRGGAGRAGERRRRRRGALRPLPIFAGRQASYIDGGQTVLDGPQRGGRVPAGRSSSTASSRATW